MSLVIIGSVAFDAIETPFGKTDKIVGGAATYASLAASYFYDKVKIVGVVGDDFHKEDIVDLNDHGIDTEGLQIKKGEFFELYSCWIGDEGAAREDELTLQMNKIDIDRIQIPEKTLVRFEK